MYSEDSIATKPDRGKRGIVGNLHTWLGITLSQCCYRLRECGEVSEVGRRE